MKSENNQDWVITLEDFPFICRICCLRRSDLKPFQEENRLFDLFLNIRKIDIYSTVDFPRNICNECIFKLEDISSFVDIFKSNSTRLEEIEYIKTTETETCHELEETSHETTRDHKQEITSQGSQTCRICSIQGNLIPLEEKAHLMQLFENITNIDVKAEINFENRYLICDICVERLEEILSFSHLSLCNDGKLEYAIGGKKCLKTERFSGQIDDLFPPNHSKLESTTGQNWLMNENSTKEKLEIVYIKEEPANSDLTDSTTKVCQNVSQTDGFEKRKERPVQSSKLQKQSHPQTEEKRKSYKCEECKRGFSRKNHLLQHLRIHTREKPFQCEFCNKKFSHSTSLKVHLSTHTGDKPFKCDICNKRFSQSSNLRKHAHSHTGEKPFKCDICDKRFTYSSNLRQHSFNHSEEKLFKCYKCDKNFTLKSSLQRHLRNHAAAKPEETSPVNDLLVCNEEKGEYAIGGKELIKTERTSNDDLFVCKDFKVENTQTNENGIEEHTLVQVKREIVYIKEEPINNDLPASTFGIHTNELESGLQIPSDEQATSEERLSQYDASGNLQQDSLKQNDGKRHKCDQCSASFVRKWLLLQHMRNHSGEKPYKCDECERGFIRKDYLLQHLFTHTKDKPFECEYCDKKFSKRNGLNRHLLTHTGEKPFKCDICDKSFSQSSNLQQHQYMHSEEKLFKCKICDKAFTIKTSLNRHVRAHNGEKPFECDLCGKCFALKQNLQQHSITHTGEKPFECEKCNRRFGHFSNLQQHLRTHSDTKLYKCDLCDKRFTRNANLQIHLRAHREEKQIQ